MANFNWNNLQASTKIFFWTAALYKTTYLKLPKNNDNHNAILLSKILNA